MTITELRKFKIQKTNIELFFITNKDGYTMFNVEIDDGLQEFFHRIISEYLEKNESLTITDFNSENEDNLYNLESTKTSIFDMKVCKQFGKTIAQFNSLMDKEKTDEIIAYCISSRDEEKKENFYCFRKVSKNKFGKDENGTKKKRIARFDTTTDKLLSDNEPIFSFDSNVDFIYRNKEFLISNKSNFEVITNYYEVYKANSEIVLSELTNSGFFIDTTSFCSAVKNNKNYQKRLSKVFDLENYKNMNPTVITHMSEVASKYGGKLKIEDSKIKLEDTKDYDLICRLLGDYYKIGEVSGESYGTFAGEHIKK